MARPVSQRMKAQRFMWDDGAAAVCGLEGQQEPSETQRELAGLLDEIAQDRRVPAEVVEKLGRLVRLANLIGQGAP